MRIALIQTAPEWRRPEASLAGIGPLVREAAQGGGARLALLPEMCATGFFMGREEGGPGLDLLVRERLSALARGHGMALVAGHASYAAAPGARGANQALIYGPDGQGLGVVVKRRAFPLLHEGRHFEPAPDDAPQPVVEIQGLRMAVFICYDLRFPELMRAVARGAHMIAVLANWPASRMSHWETLLRARAIENQCYVAGVNRRGADGNGLSYTGGSLAFSPMGDELARGGPDEPIVYFEADPLEVGRTRSLYPFLPA